MHDLEHIRQIAELVRARKHLQAAGKLFPAAGLGGGQCRLSVTAS